MANSPCRDMKPEDPPRAGNGFGRVSRGRKVAKRAAGVSPAAAAAAAGAPDAAPAPGGGGGGGGAADQPAPIPGVFSTRLPPPLPRRGPSQEGAKCCVQLPGARGPWVGPNMREARAFVAVRPRGCTFGALRPVHPACPSQPSFCLPPPCARPCGLRARACALSTLIAPSRRPAARRAAGLKAQDDC